MPIDVIMPALSPTMESGTIVRWLKRLGEPVRVGEVLLEVETDKATLEVEALATGTLTSIHYQEGATDVPVNVRLGTIAEEHEGTDAGTTPPNAVAKTAQVASGDAGRDSIWQLLASPKQDGFDDRIFASPIARRLMTEAGIDPRLVKGTGPNGRILERDVTATPTIRTRPSHSESPAALLQTPAPPPSIGQVSSALKTQFSEGRYEEVPHDGMRRVIARRLTEAKQSVPHFYLTVDCRLDPLLKLREQLNRGHSDEAERLSLNDFFIKALARALVLVPDANVSFAEDVMIRHKHADIAVAVAIPGGLMTPVLMDADTKPLLTISAEMKELIRRAQARRISPQEYEGGTAGLSNLGMFGVREFAAILNPPQATMLAVGAAEKRMIVFEDLPTVAIVFTATLSVDHRAVDGAVAAKFLSAFKTLVEAPVSMLV
jgi:pyruvate dehydrogenase E2 component (dihydrolipoamide acetyltransferase)